MGDTSADDVTFHTEAIKLLLQVAWANDELDASVSPATTARIVAKATALMMAMSMVPPNESAPPPRYCESSGAAELALPGASRMALGPTRAAAP